MYFFVHFRTDFFKRGLCAMGKRIHRLKTWMMENAYLVTLGCLMAIVVSCAIYTRELRQSQQSGVQAAAGAPEIQASIEPTSTPAPTPLPTIAPLAVRPVALVDRGGAWPVRGRILRAHDLQQMVHWQTLGTWQTHNGLDIAGEADERVEACLDGEVTHAAWDELWGWRVRIRHDDERETVYAGLASCLTAVGESVRRGQIIGTLLESIPCEAEMGTHVHMEMYRGGKAQDPEASLSIR